MSTKHTYTIGSLSKIGGGILLKASLLRSLLFILFISLFTGISLSSCEKEMLPDPVPTPYDEDADDTRGAVPDSTSGGQVYIGDITINTEWEGETFINF